MARYQRDRRNDPLVKAKAAGYEKKYRQNHPEKIRELTAGWRARNRERLRLEQAEIRKRRGKEKQSELQRASYAKHAEERRAQKREYRVANLPKVRIWAANRDARERGATGSYTLSDVLVLFEKQRRKCATCKTSISAKKGKKKFHVDHVQPVSRGGSNNPENLQLLCATCNLKKHKKTPEEWAALNGLLFC